jgi:hypothetical protein
MSEAAVPNPQDRALAALRGIIQQEVAQFFYSARYPYVTQSGGGASPLNGIASDPNMPPAQQVPMRTGVPGLVAQPAPGSAFSVGFLSGDPSSPIAGDYDSAQALSLLFNALSIGLGPSPQASQEGVVLNQLLQAVLSAVKTWIVAAQAALANITGGPGPLSGTAAQSALTAACVAALTALEAALGVPIASTTVTASP